MSASANLHTFEPCAVTAASGPIHFAGNGSRNSAPPACGRLLHFTLVGLVLFAAISSFAATTPPPVKAHLSGTSFVQPIGSGFQQPEQIAVDSIGNLYIADSQTNNVYKETLVAGVYTQSILRANLGGPIGVTVDSNGNVYIADSDNSRVLKETLEDNGTYEESVVPTSGLAALVWNLTVDSKGNVYICDALNNRVVKETVTINSGYSQSIIPATGLLSPEGVAVDTQGNLYIADSFNNRIVKETISGSTYTQSVIVPPVLPLGPAGVNAPQEIWLSGTTLFIADTLNNRIAKATYNATTKAYTLSTATTGSLNAPSGVAVGPNGELFITDTNNQRVIAASGDGTDFGGIPVGQTSSAATLTFTFDNGGKIGAPLIQAYVGGIFTKVSGTTCTSGSTFATGKTCAIMVTFAPTGAGITYGVVELKDPSNNVLASAEITGTGIGTKVIYPNNASDSTIGIGLKTDRAVAVDLSGNVYIAESGYSALLSSNQVLKVTPTGAQSTVSKTLKSPISVAVDRAGNVFISDVAAKQVLEETPAPGGTYTETVVYGIAASSHDTAVPGVLAVDRDGNLFVAFPGAVAEFSLVSGTWTQVGTIAVIAVTGNEHNVHLPTPESLAVDDAGNIYIGEGEDSAAGVKAQLTRVAPGGTGLAQELIEQGITPTAIAVDRIGNVFLVHGDTLDVFVPTGTPHSTEGSSLKSYYLDVSLQTKSALSQPDGLAVDANNLLYIANTDLSQVLKESWASAPAYNFPQTVVGTTSSAIVQSVLNIGNAAVDFAVPATGQNPTVPAGYVLNTGELDACPALTASSDPATLDPGSECSVSLSFSPNALASFTGSLTYKANVGPQNQFAFNLSGKGIATVPNITWSAPASIAYGTALSATQLNASASYNGQTVPGTFTYTPTLGAVLSAGTHLLSVRFAPSGVGYSNTSASVSITVTKVPLTIVADSFMRPYGSPNPAFTASYIGFVNGDGPGSLFGSLTFSTEATQQFPWGYYPITVSSNGGSTQTNYDVTYVDGTLVITQVALTVTADSMSVTNSSDIPNPYPCTITGFVNGDTAAVVAGMCANDAQNYSNSPSDSYTVTPTIGTLSALNYTFTNFVPGTLTISESQVKRGVTKVAAKPVAPVKRPLIQRR